MSAPILHVLLERKARKPAAEKAAPYLLSQLQAHYCAYSQAFCDETQNKTKRKDSKVGQAHNQDQRTCILEDEVHTRLGQRGSGCVAITAAMATWLVSIPRSPEELPVSWIGWSGLWCQGVLNSTLVSPLGSRTSLGKLPYLSEAICSLTNIIIPSIQGWWEDPMR